jgi:hypothetical protein
VLKLKIDKVTVIRVYANALVATLSWSRECRSKFRSDTAVHDPISARPIWSTFYRFYIFDETCNVRKTGESHNEFMNKFSISI